MMRAFSKRFPKFSLDNRILYSSVLMLYQQIGDADDLESYAREGLAAFPEEYHI